MIYLILIVAFAILVALLLLLRSFYQLRADFARFRRKISEQSNDYVFLINKDLEVKDTNYYDLNTDQQKEPCWAMCCIARTAVMRASAARALPARHVLCG